MLNRYCAVLIMAALPVAATASDAACAAPQTQTALAAKLVDAAVLEYRQFPGHRIDAEGRIWKFGAVEADTTPLYDPATGKPDSGQPGHYAWRRVWQYWQTLNIHAPEEEDERQLTSIHGLLDGDAGKPQRLTVGALSAQLAALDPEVRETVRQTIVRAALTDTPWSAAFISYLMHQAGLSKTQFQFSATHANYIRKAFEQPEGYAYRACDPRTTQPRKGDLICYSRDRKPLVGFQAWQDAAGSLGNDVKSHCDLVVAVDQRARKIEVIGGNVLQSVSMRRLKLNGNGTLSRSYQAEHDLHRRSDECMRDLTCSKSNLNVQYWGVLLQLR